eukprot:scaffold4233_cov180-Ochromonas_danica.AAC.25
MKGYFPRNYVKPLPRRVAPPAPRPPPRPLSLAATPLDVGKVAASVAALSVREEKAAAEQEEGRARPFSIKSLPAFDHLMEKGFSVEIDGASPSGSGSGSAESEAGPVLPRRGQEVSVDCVALLWDGAHSSAKEFTAGPLRFKLGKQAVVPGLEAALYSIPVGRSATVTCSPSMAYGSAGCPPLVPPNAFVVFLLTLQAVREPDEGEEEAVPQAPAGIFVSDLPQARRASLQRKRDRLVLSSSSSSAAQQSGFAFPDDAAAGTSASVEGVHREAPLAQVGVGAVDSRGGPFLRGIEGHRGGSSALLVGDLDPSHAVPRPVRVSISRHGSHALRAGRGVSDVSSSEYIDLRGLCSAFQRNVDTGVVCVHDGHAKPGTTADGRAVQLRPCPAIVALPAVPSAIESVIGRGVGAVVEPSAIPTQQHQALLAVRIGLRGGVPVALRDQPSAHSGGPGSVWQASPVEERVSGATRLTFVTLLSIQTSLFSGVPPIIQSFSLKIAVACQARADHGAVPAYLPQTSRQIANAEEEQEEEEVDLQPVVAVLGDPEVVGGEGREAAHEDHEVVHAVAVDVHGVQTVSVPLEPRSDGSRLHHVNVLRVEVPRERSLLHPRGAIGTLPDVRHLVGRVQVVLGVGVGASARHPNLALEDARGVSVAAGEFDAIGTGQVVPAGRRRGRACDVDEMVEEETETETVKEANLPHSIPIPSHSTAAQRNRNRSRRSAFLFAIAFLCFIIAFLVSGSAASEKIKNENQNIETRNTMSGKLSERFASLKPATPPQSAGGRGGGKPSPRDNRVSSRIAAQKAQRSSQTQSRRGLVTVPPAAGTTSRGNAPRGKGNAAKTWRERVALPRRRAATSASPRRKSRRKTSTRRWTAVSLPLLLHLLLLLLISLVRLSRDTDWFAAGKGPNPEVVSLDREMDDYFKTRSTTLEVTAPAESAAMETTTN